LSNVLRKLETRDSENGANGTGLVYQAAIWLILIFKCLRSRISLRRMRIRFRRMRICIVPDTDLYCARCGFNFGVKFFIELNELCLRNIGESMRRRYLGRVSFIFGRDGRLGGSN
jgi:hypothetical protein